VPTERRRFVEVSATAGTGFVQLSDLTVSIVATGGSTGDIFRVFAIDRQGGPVPLNAPDGLVLQPLKEKLEAARARVLSQLPGQRLSAYCLDFSKLPPAGGMLYRIADDALQQQFAPMTRILQSARSLASGGLLHPDSDPAAYVNSIKQWSLWGRIEKFDASAFERQFIDHTRKAVEAAKGRWTKDVEQQVRSLVPNRWRDILAVWADADTPRPAEAR
jgi:hypothetical protein